MKTYKGKFRLIHKIDDSELSFEYSEDELTESFEEVEDIKERILSTILEEVCQDWDKYFNPTIEIVELEEELK